MEKFFKWFALFLCIPLVLVIISSLIYYKQTQEKHRQDILWVESRIKASECEKRWSRRYDKATRNQVIAAPEVSAHWKKVCAWGLSDFNEHAFNEWFNNLDPRYKDVEACKDRWRSAALQNNADFPVSRWEWRQEIEKLCLAGIYYDDQTEEHKTTYFNTPPKEISVYDYPCLDEWITAYRKEAGEDAVIKWDIIEEWKGWCNEGKNPNNYRP